MSGVGLPKSLGAIWAQNPPSVARKKEHSGEGRVGAGPPRSLAQ